MKSCFKRIVALLTIFTVVAGMLYCINVSAASDIWVAVKGSPTFADIEDGYTNISVSVDKAVITKQKYNFEDNAVYIENYDEETNMWYGMYIYYGFNLSGAGLEVISVGNEARIVVWGGKERRYHASGSARGKLHHPARKQ